MENRNETRVNIGKSIFNVLGYFLQTKRKRKKLTTFE